nr:PQQ-dependent sugar dehydrogenase [uncultured Aminipila sp.]
MALRGRGTVKANLNIIAMSEIPYEIEVIAENLNIPWAIDISAEGRLYFTERPGAIRVIENGKLLQQPLITFGAPFVSQGEGGLMGIALDPNFSENHYIYVMHSYAEGNQIYNRVVKLVEQNNQAFIYQILLNKIPGGIIHNGGRLKIGPDQRLYITTGDAGNSVLAQDITSTAGKILRIELDGRIPEDNPITDSPIYSLGHRNPQGLAWNPANILYASEHGQTAHDEINIIQPGANYGWPFVQGDETSVEMEIQRPLVHSGEDTWAPSGIAFVNQGPWQGKLLVAALRGEELLVISLNEEGTEVENIESWLHNEYGRLREVIQAKDGSIYFATSNRDGRGAPDKADDKIIRLVPIKALWDYDWLKA